MVKIFDFYSSSGINKKIGCILIYGDGALVQGIDTYIKGLLNIDTRLFEQRFLKHVAGIDDGFKENIYQYLNCISLLL
jgi:Tfp pilus assembly PilM family ATPase